MKLNKIFMALAAMAMVGCSSEDLNDFAVNQAIDESGLVQLDENFVLAGVGEGDATTRTHWDVPASGKVKNVFLPIYGATAPDGTKTLDKFADFDENVEAVGLCWLGQNGGTDTDVYTNYEFYHFGWLNDGAKKAVFECDELTNGALYSEIVPTSGTAGKEADPTKFTLPTPKCDGGLDYNSGVYKTENKAIFGGKYVVYYPFNPDFKNQGTIPAVATTVFDAVPTTVGDPKLAKATFRYSTSSVDIEGGNQAANFGLQNLSTLVQFRIFTGNAAAGSKVIDQIVLYSAKEQLLKEVHLDASKIAAGVESNKGTELYVAEKSKGTKTIVANSAGITTDPTVNNHVNAFITVLPTTAAVEDLKVLVHNKSEKKWATYSIPANKAQFKASAAQILDITLKSGDFKQDFIAVDEASLKTAVTEADGLGKSIQVIGDITITSDYTINDNTVTIKGDAIIVPEDVTLNVNVKKMESDVRVLGKSCCSGTQGGRLFINGGTFGNITMKPAEATVTEANYDIYNPAVTYDGDAKIDADKTFDAQAGNVTVNKAVAHKGNINIAEGVTLTVNATGDLNFMGATVVNNGTIEVKKNGKFDMTDSDGNAHAADGERMTNNGKFIHNVDAGVGTAVQSMNQNGEYRCKVDDQVKLDDAYLQWKACNIIEIVEPDPADAKPYDLVHACQHKVKGEMKYVDIEVNTTNKVTFTNPKPQNDEINIGNLTVTAGALDIDYVNTVGTTTGKRVLTVNGDMTVKANTTFIDSKLINIKENLIVEKGALATTLSYKGKKSNEGGLQVAKDIKVSNATFDAGSDALGADYKVDAIKINCANFTLAKGAKAIFGNRTEGDTKNMVVTGTITVPVGCDFEIKKAGQVGGSVLAWVSCHELIAQGTFSGGSKPRVE